jgi:peroxiredoxin
MRFLLTLLTALALTLPAAAMAGEGEPASDFTLKSLDGENIALGDYLGKEVLVLSFWATWCGPCLKEMPKLMEMQTELKDQGVRVLWISVDDTKDEAKVGGIARRFKLPGDQVLLDFERKVVSQYHKRGVPPFTVVIDKNKNKILEKLGYTEGDEKKIHEKVTGAL